MMEQQGMHRCIHHIVEKILVTLAWLAGIGFVISSWTGYPFWRWDSTGYFQVVVVFVLLALGTKMCSCHFMHGGMKKGMMMGKMCTDANCKEMHDEQGKHMM